MIRKVFTVTGPEPDPDTFAKCLDLCLNPNIFKVLGSNVLISFYVGGRGREANT